VSAGARARTGTSVELQRAIASVIKHSAIGNSKPAMMVKAAQSVLEALRVAPPELNLIEALDHLQIVQRQIQDGVDPQLMLPNIDVASWQVLAALGQIRQRAEVRS
jgi:hypothetical protein